MKKVLITGAAGFLGSHLCDRFIKEGFYVIGMDNFITGDKKNIRDLINHSVSEFVVDFVNIMPGVPKSKVKSRIILTPQHAKRLLKALGENVARFENAHGEIKDYEQPPMPLNCGPTGQA